MEIVSYFFVQIIILVWDTLKNNAFIDPCGQNIFDN